MLLNVDSDDPSAVYAAGAQAAGVDSRDQPPRKTAEELNDPATQWKAYQERKQEEVHREQHERDCRAWEAYWKKLADEKRWDEVKADLSVYKYCGKKVTTDVRRTEAYRLQVLKELKLTEDDTRDAATKADMAVIRELV